MPNARNRKRKPGRRKPFLDPKPRILIVTEGEKTERQYFEGFWKSCRNPRVWIKVADEHGVPVTLVRTAKQYKEEAEQDATREKDDNLAFDSVWCVFDIDDHPKVTEAKVTARDNNIDLAVSNPCFEMWLLLHFRDNPGMQHRDKIEQMLKKHVPGYDKTVDYDTYSIGYPQAVIRAERMDCSAGEANEPERNPTTGVYNLTELIRTK
ncbi:MAG: RloB family protein [Planctomycetes bacterium]|nr:RloB family protein [Planctomycetota bacterium]MBU4397733.1 RloB family protein [Planctomycetota bacterium]MCG2682752.1 RloB family protein [Planctomycetales bacterium]